MNTTTRPLTADQIDVLAVVRDGRITCAQLADDYYDGDRVRARRILVQLHTRGLVRPWRVDPRYWVVTDDGRDALA